MTFNDNEVSQRQEGANKKETGAHLENISELSMFPRSAHRKGGKETTKAKPPTHGYHGTMVRRPARILDQLVHGAGWSGERGGTPGSDDWRQMSKIPL